MKKNLTLCCLLVAFILQAQNNVGIGTVTPNASAILEMQSSDKGLLVPRMSSNQRTTINMPANGLLVFDTDTGCFFFYTGVGSQWKSLCNNTGGINSQGVDFNCGVGTLSIQTPSGTYTSSQKAWLSSGDSIGAVDYFGTRNNSDIRISTNNSACIFDSTHQKMIITADGYVGIGKFDGNRMPYRGRSKLVVQNGKYFNPFLTSNLPPDSAITILALSHTGRGANFGVVSLAEEQFSVNFGLAGQARGDSASFNIGAGALAQGDSGCVNQGTQGEARGTGNVLNLGAVGYAHGNNNNLFIPSSLGGAGYYNAGVRGFAYGNNSKNFGLLGHINDNCSNSDNYGLYASVTSVSGNRNYGVFGDLSYKVHSGICYGVVGAQPTVPAASAPQPPQVASTPFVSYAGYFIGDVFCANTYYYSDPKLKRNIQPYTGGLSKLLQLHIKSYDFNTDQYARMSLPTGKQTGLLSTEMKEVFPELVKRTIHPAFGEQNEDIPFDAVNYTALVPVLIQAIQELEQKIEWLEKKVAEK